MDNLCNSCKDRFKCSTLCEKAKTYANQDEVKQKELTIGLVMTVKKEWSTYKSNTQNRLSFIRDSKSLSNRERQILRLLVTGLSKSEIMETLDISIHNLDQRLYLLRKKIKNF